MINKTFKNSRFTSLAIAVLGGIWAWFIHCDNIEYLRSINSPKEEKGMVLTSDDVGYIRPAENFVNIGVWKDNTQGISSYIARTPGMGIIHLLFYKLSPHHHQQFHQCFNLMLHVFSLYFFGILCFFLLKKPWALIINITFAFLPSFWGYIFYYLTEPITVPLMIFLFYTYVRYHQLPSSKWILLQGILAGILIMVRPQLLFFILPFAYFLIHFLIHGSSKAIIVSVLAFIFAFGAFISWEVRSAKIAHRFTWFHGIYDEANSSQYRPVHQSFVELFKVYDWDNKRFHTMMLDAWEPNFEPTDQWLDKNVLLHGCIGITKEDIKLFLQEYSLIAKRQRPVFEAGGVIPKEEEDEMALRIKLDKLTTRLKKKNWFLCNILGPIHSGQFMIVKSQLNLAIFQHKYRGLWWMEALRWTCMLVVLFSFSFSLLQISNIKNKPYFLFIISTLIYFFYLCFVHKINEERYVVPLLPILFLMAVDRLKLIFYIFKEKVSN